MKGHFITFEGGDGVGKTTLIQSLYHLLLKKGHQLLLTRAPGGTELGKILRKLVLHPDHPAVPRAETLLYLADRAQQVEEVILPALQEGKVVLCDRYNDSTFAYQAIARNLPIDEVKVLCDFATKHLKPDLTIYLDLDPKIGLERVKQAAKTHDHMEKENLVFHETTRAAFLSIARQEPSRFQILDAAKSKEEVLVDALKLIDEYFCANSAS